VRFVADQDFLLLQHSAVTDLDRSISDQRLRLFYFIKLYFKSKLFDLYLTFEIQNRVQKAQQKIQIHATIVRDYPIKSKRQKLTL
jgi:hypothetical protein